MAASVPATLLLIAAALAAAIALSLVRSRVRALEAAFVGVRLDLAARDEARRDADRARRQMLAEVSHELKAPLTALRGYLETLHAPDLDLDPSVRERYFHTIERETVRLDRLADDLLDLAQLDARVGVIDARLFAIERVFQHVMLRHEHETRQREIEVDVSVAEEADQIVADPERIEQMVENLFASALRDTPAGGQIELRANGDGSAVVLSVVHSGRGIPADRVPFVFDRFYPAEGSRRRDAPASGLGLSIAKAIVERHHGSIGVTSVPGCTTFTIVLPHQSAEPAHHSTSTNL